MTKQEEIREMILTCFAGCYELGFQEARGKECANTDLGTRVDALLKWLKFKGTVIKVDRELPILFPEEKTLAQKNANYGFKMAIEAGFVVVEPIIGGSDEKTITQ